MTNGVGTWTNVLSEPINAATIAIPLNSETLKNTTKSSKTHFQIVQIAKRR